VSPRRKGVKRYAYAIIAGFEFVLGDECGWARGAKTLRTGFRF
jgi:hypothetical protein